MKKFLLLLGTLGFFLLTSCHKEESVEIKFESNGGSTISTITNKEQLDFDNLPMPTKEGYTFMGWFVDSELTKDIESNRPEYLKFTLYAKWLINDYVITFDSDGGSIVESITVPYNTSVNLPTPTKENYVFQGWCLSSALDDPIISITMPANDITLLASWEEIVYQVTFNSNGGSEVNSQDVIINHTATIPTPPTKTGYEFMGWYTDDDLINPFHFTTEITHHLTLYAKWQIKQFTITFVSGAEIAVTSITADYNKSITAPDVPIRAGYTFIGWYEDEALTIQFVFDKMPAENITLYAKWMAGDAVIQFNTNGGTSINPITGKIDSTITPPENPTKTGYDFVGWYIDSQISEPFTDWVMPVGGITLYAKWTPALTTITFNSLGGSEVQTITAPYLSTITKPEDPIKEGYIFDGWYTDTAFNTLFVFNQMPAENTTLYAYWIDENAGMSIRNIKTKESQTEITTTGIVLSKLSDDYLGFYIADHTGQIFVNYDQSLVSIGDEIRIVGKYCLLNGVPMIVNITEFEVINQGSPLVPSNERTINFINNINHLDLNNYARYIKTTGILIYQDGFYYLDDGLGHRIKLSHYSYIDALHSAINQYVELNVILHQYDETNQSWIATYLFNSLQTLQKTDGEKLDMIEDYIISHYQHKTYWPNDYFIIPATDDFSWSNISYQAIGDNAHLFNQDTKQFLEPTGDTTVDFEVTLTLGDESKTFTITVYLNLSITSIIDFINATDHAFYTIIGTVTFVSEGEGFSLISDETGTIYYNDTHFMMGDQVKITAQKSVRDYFVFIDSLPKNKYEILSSNNTFNHTPLQLSLEELSLLDQTDSTIYGQYVELRGFLRMSDDDYYLYNDDFSYYINEVSENSYEILYNCLDIEIIIRGYLLYIDDELTFTFFGYRNELEIPDYTDEELVNLLQTIFVNQYGDKVFTPYETFELLPFNKVLGGDISWHFSDETLSLINPNTNAFIYVTESHPVQIDIVIQKNQAILEFTYSTTLEPISFYDAWDTLESGINPYIRGLVIYHNYDYTYLRYGDEILRIYGEIPAYKGDMVIVKIYTEFSEGDHSGYIDPDDFFFQVLSRNNPYEIEATPMTIEDFNDYREYDYAFYNDYIEVSGQLKFNNRTFILTDGQKEVHIEPSDGFVWDHLETYVEQDITIKAYVQGYDSETKIWTLYYTGLDGEFEVVTYTDTEKHIIVQNYVTELYQEQYYTPDTSFEFETTHPFIDCTISYEVMGDNAQYLNLTYGIIYEVTETTQVTVRVTVNINDTINTFDIIFTIVPYGSNTREIVSIETFKNSNGETLTIKGVVVSISYDYFLIEDDSGRIFVETDTYQTLSNLGKLVEITGNLSSYNGRKQVNKDYQMTIVGQNQIVLIDYNDTPLSDIVKHDFYDERQYGKSVTLTGLVISKLDENYRTHFYLTDGYDEVRLDAYQSYQFYNYVGFEITVRGFIYGLSKNSLDDVWTINVLPSSQTIQDYTTDELIDIIGNGIIESFDGEYYKSYSSIYFPTHHSLIYYADIDYAVTNDIDHIIDLNRQIIGAVEDDTTFEIKVTITLNDTSKDFYFYIHVRGIKSIDIDDLENPNHNLYDDIAAKVQYFYGIEGTKYYLHNGKVYVLNDHYQYPYTIDEGDFVYLRGVKNVIDELGGFGYEVGIVDANESSDEFEVESYPISIMEIYQVDLDTFDLTEKYLKVYGQLLYDEYMKMYYIENEDYMLYIRVDRYERSRLRHEDDGGYYYHFERHLYNEVYLEVLFPNIVVRGDIFLVDYKETASSLTYPDLTPNERIEATKNYLQRTYEGKTYHPNDYLTLIEYHEMYGTNITWLINSNYIDNNVFKFVYERKSITLIGIISYEENGYTHPTHQISITIYVEPPIISPIIEASRGFIGQEYTIQGVVQEYDSLENDAWMLLKDETGLILVDYYFEGIEVGDEIIVTGVRSTLIYGTIPCLDLRGNALLTIVSRNNPVVKLPIEMTHEEIEKFDYMHPDDHGQLVTITGVVNKLYYYTYRLENEDLKIAIDYTIVDPYDGKAKLDELIGYEIKLTGYLLGIESPYEDSYWIITFSGNPSDYIIISEPSD